MIAKAELKFTRGSAKKIRQVLDLIRNLDVGKALSVLSTINKRPKFVVEKLLRSAISNAKNKGLKEENLYISKIVADEAARWKRYRSAAFGRAEEILKRTSHIKVELDLKSDKMRPGFTQPKQPPSKLGGLRRGLDESRKAKAKTQSSKV